MINLLCLSNESQDFVEADKILSTAGYVFFYATKWDDFHQIIREHKIKIILFDRDQEKGLDLTFLKKIKNFDPQIDIIVVGNGVPASEMVECVKEGGTDYLIKPVDLKQLIKILKKIEDKVLLRKRTHRLETQLAKKYIFEGMTGKNPAMLEVFALIERVAKYPSSVLITGETGTGKEMVSRAIHNLSNRKNHKMVTCDCTAIPETLFESELFGYVRGAFTGAETSKDGLFKEAHEGTIFFDEIGEIPLSFQTKLLRVLEDKRFRRLGSNKVISVDIRLISATIRDLRKNIREGSFREDLFHRINVMEIPLPPLRKRKDDISLLCRCFLEKYNRKFNKNVRGISQRVQKCLLNYQWPGNVRELENLIERAVMLCQENFIDVKDMPEIILQESFNLPKPGEIPYPFLNQSLMEIEKRHILETLKYTGGNKQKAAKILGITRQSFYRKLKKFNIPL